MTREQMSDEAYTDLLNEILKILMKNGIKATKMDDIATHQQMSKRTLYEIFGSKENMVVEAVNLFNRNLLLDNLGYYRENPNVIDAIIMTFVIYRKIMIHLDVHFFTDFEALSPDIRERAADSDREYFSYFINLFDQAAEKGYIRTDINYHLQARILQVQMGLLKRMSEFFPSDISLLEIYDSNTVAFLRAIASPEGLKEFDPRLVHFSEISAHSCQK
jgi:AcrR family transcriptional regulator